ncbi:xanthine dehydrogenase family protein subunit M [Chelatococcus sp. SYSU_G07232]|uniref:Xanthine dehydrogenase family protein subunit M n=1 Tax=Chelatococcus albus TaxID=3047466 RepID=A0ABT7AH34_9HYPH|nr:xanthine dehydrogenase family protein subunit M [Chelatococcus sp. SYSU_G07232]MDJ1158395.1 xanthine dehydrogenase family protein subunit M [Chelatococcus sp. SYSU_G07232]
MYAFDYHRPKSLRQAVNLLAKVEDAKLLAGGHTLLPTMKQRLAAPANIIDLNGIAELAGIERKGRAVVIGAMTRHADVAESPIVQEAIPALAELADQIGDPQVRNRGTIGGSIANNDPAADYPAACIALGATIITNKRKVPAEEFFTGLFETALEEGEIITRVSFPLPSKAAYMKFPNPASRYALVGVFVAKRGAEVRVAVTGAGADGVFRVGAMEEALKARFSPKSLEGIKVPSKGLNSDIHADADYRAHLIGVMARRAVANATGKA